MNEPHLIVDELDIGFYRSFYRDLRGLLDEDLRRHYLQHGRGEQRFANEQELLTYFSNSDVKLPDDFAPEDYLMLHPDVEEICDSKWGAIYHYLKYGAIEGRGYKALDIDFYRDLYHSGRHVSQEQIEAEIKSAQPHSRKFRSMAELLRAYGVPNQDWLNCFSEREFCLLNFNWVERNLNRAEAVYLFLDQGIDRLAPMGFKWHFDPNFYKTLHPLEARAGQADLYRHWLNHNRQSRYDCSPQTWLNHRGLEMLSFPDAFQWAHYAQKQCLKQDSGTGAAAWIALEHLLASNSTDVANVPVSGPQSASFLEALGLHSSAKRHFDVAITLFKRSKELSDSLKPDLLLGGVYMEIEDWQSAVDAYHSYHQSGGRTLSSVVNSAICLSKLSRFDESFDLLNKNKTEYSGHRSWSAALNLIADEAFNSETARARLSYDSNRRDIGDEIITNAVRRSINIWKKGLSLPEPDFLYQQKRVVILATTSLKQCKYYRLDQKQEYLQSLGIECEVFDYSEVDAFISRLPGSCSAIFYRVPALPNVVKAILTATSLGIPTFYDIDDLIFDSACYPDPYEFFCGTISESSYRELMVGTILYREAMALCDFGIASTPALVNRVQEVVKSKCAYLVRNSLDSRLLMPRAPLLPWPNEREGEVRIFYGSGTLSHNLDFNDIAVAVLLPLMITNPNIHLVLAGYIKVDDRFNVVERQVQRLGLINDIDLYWSVLAACHINIATLADTEMNNAKSEIKWLEAAVHGVPSVVSATQTYCEVIENDVTGLISRSIEEWRFNVTSLIDDPQKRRKMGDAARREVMQKYGAAEAAQVLVDTIYSKRDVPRERNKKKRLLVVNAFYPPQSIGGATRVVADMVRSWLSSEAAEGWEFAISTTDYDSPTAYQQTVDSIDGVMVFRIAAPLIDNLDWIPYDPIMKQSFARLIDVYKPDIVHFHSIQRLTASIVEACIEAGIPYVVSVHDGWWLSDYQFLFDENAVPRTPGDEWERGLKRNVSLEQSLD